MASWSVLAAVDGLLLRGCVVASETDRSAQAKGVEYLTRFVHTLPLADTPLAAPRACLPTLPSISKGRIRNTRDCRLISCSFSSFTRAECEGVETAV